MTVPSTTNKVQYDGNDVATVFTFPFKVFEKTDLEVIVRDIYGTETLQTVDVDFSASGVGDPTGSITYPITGSPLATGEIIFIRRVLLEVQNTDLRAQGAWSPEVVEDEFDRSRMIDQQQQEELGRIVKFKPTTSITTASIEYPDPDPGKVIGWGADSNLTNVDFTSISTTNVPFCATITALKAVDVTTDTQAFVNGSSTPVDGGQSRWFYDAASGATPDDINVVKPNSVTLPDPGRWLIIPVGTVGLSDSSVTTAKIATGATTMAKVEQETIRGIRRKNFLINGDFQIDQRGITWTGTTDTNYYSDQWQLGFDLDGGSAASDSVDVTAFTVGQTDVPGNPLNYLEFTNRVTGSSNDERVFMANNIENLKQFSGQEVTLSFYIKGSTTGTARYALSAEYGTGGSPSSQEFLLNADTDISVTTSWQKVTRTVTLSSLSGKTFGSNDDDHLRVMIIKQLGSTAATAFGGSGAFDFNGTLQIADVQLELGPTATPFGRLDYGTQLALCRRYFQWYHITADSPNIARGFGINVCRSGTIPFSQKMRTTPSAAFGTGVATIACEAVRLDTYVAQTATMAPVGVLHGLGWAWNSVTVGTYVDNIAYYLRPTVSENVIFSAEL